MTDKQTDWRLRGQERYLEGATLIRKRYRAWSEEWEHDHCAFCWAKFMDPTFSPDHERFVAEHPEVLTEGYAVKGRRPENSGEAEPQLRSTQRDDYWWVCPTCVADFAERFQWTVSDDPDLRTRSRRPQ